MKKVVFLIFCIFIINTSFSQNKKYQREKMERLDILGQFIELVKLNQDIQFNMITKANLPKVDNLNIL